MVNYKNFLEDYFSQEKEVQAAIDRNKAFLN